MARIAFVLPDLTGGGAERVALTLIEAFIDRGHEIDLVLAQGHGELLEQLPSSVRLFDLAAAGTATTLMRLRRYLRDHRPDAVQVSMWPLTIIAILAHRLAGSRARLVVSDHTTLSLHYGGTLRLRAALRLSTYLFYPWADARVIVSERAAEDLARVSGLPRASIDVIYNPIATPPPAPDDPAVQGLWRGDGSARILSVGKLKAVKNYPLLIRAFARLAKRRPAQLMIVGEGPDREALVRIAAAEEVDDRVILPGYAANPWPYYASAQLFVLTSDYEGFGNVLVEAMAMGVPVVSSDCESGPGEILAGGRFGRLVACGDVDGLAAAMEEALDSAADPAALKARAEELSGGGSVERYLALLLAERPRQAAKP